METDHYQGIYSHLQLEQYSHFLRYIFFWMKLIQSRRDGDRDKMPSARYTEPQLGDPKET